MLDDITMQDTLQAAEDLSVILVTHDRRSAEPNRRLYFIAYCIFQGCGA